MPVNWQDGKGRNPNAPYLGWSGGIIIPPTCSLLMGDIIIPVDLYAPLQNSSEALLGQIGPRQGCG